MTDIAAKSRPLRYRTRQGQHRPFAAGISIVESQALPSDDATLTSALRLTPASSTCDTVIALRDASGALLAVASITRADRSSLELGGPAGRTTAYLADLAVSEHATHVLPLILYAAARRARIAGATLLATHLFDPDRSITATLDLAPADELAWIPAAQGRSFVPAVGRLDVAIDRAWSTWATRGKPTPSSALFVDEVSETIERWLEDIYGRGFFRAVFERTLTRDQYVYAASNMHQFVRWTTRLLGAAVASSHDRTLRNHYLAHLGGEINHEVIIERDLAHLGVDVEYVIARMVASPHTRQFMAIQESLIGYHRDPIGFMASPLVAEGIASHLTPAFVEALEATIARWGVREPRKAMTFFTSHVHTDGGDDGHWETGLSMLGAYLTYEPALARFLGLLRASMSALTGAYDEYVDRLPTLGPRERLAQPASVDAARPQPTERSGDAAF